jgi:hypothetical protein
MGPSEAAVVVAACWPVRLSTAGGSCTAAGAWFSTPKAKGSCVEIGHASGVLGWEGWRLLLLLLLLLLLEASKKLFHQGISFSASFASCGDLLVGWHGIDWFSSGCFVGSIDRIKAVNAPKVWPRVKFPPRNTYLSHHKSDHNISQNHSLFN